MSRYFDFPDFPADQSSAHVSVPRNELTLICLLAITDCYKKQVKAARPNSACHRNRRINVGDGVAIEARDVSKIFGTSTDQEVWALDHVSVSIAQNEFFTLLGPSGCGKTTLLRLIAGFEHPTDGAILLEGEDISALPPFQRPVNTVFQNYALFPHMTVAQNIGFGLEMQGRPKDEVADTVGAMLSLVKMENLKDRRVDQISGGQQQRVALARALAPRPKVLLLDEPLSALDLKLRKEMQLELKRLQHETGITFIFVTHDQEEALTMSDRVAVMRDGEIHQIGSPQDIYNRPNNRFVADFIGESNFLEVQLLSRNGSTAKVRFANGTELDATLPSTDVTSGSITVIVRPEHARLTADRSAGHLQGVVNDAVYFGTDTHYYLTLDGGEEFVIRQQNQRGDRGKISSGTQVGVTINEDSIQVLAN
ncbi:MAG: spermidine/putrescine ABC transporter ATP-binding protein [Acidiferrobacteraceae bacterium]|nr:spermidine/putrescine ABC transporter ATP-binding protein [Acidiferrobacteraceae bacterium]|tara:strand:+ start:7542 stop:8810 length:1269 start_codon:yes stop_codon:yes gene_type:complete